MEYFERLFKITFDDSAASGTEGSIVVVPGETVHWAVNVIFDNRGSDLEKDACAFLCHIGETSFQSVWSSLFRHITLTPFVFISPPSVDGKNDNDAGREEGEENPPPVTASTPLRGFEFGIPSFWLQSCCSSLSARGTASSGSSSGGVSDAHHIIGETVSVPCAEDVYRDGEGGGSIPAFAMRVFHFDYIVPEEIGALALAAGDGDGADGVRKAEEGDDKGGRASSSSSDSSDSGSEGRLWLGLVPCVSCVEDGFDVCWGVLSRSYMNELIGGVCGGGGGPPGFLPEASSLPLGCWYVSLDACDALQCHPVMSPLSNDRFVLNLRITNNGLSEGPIVLHGVSFDLHSTTLSSAASPSPSVAGREVHSTRMKRRPGPRGADMRLVDVLNKIITVTPMVISDDKPPFVLQPDETYSFQFVLEVIPQLCYLLNPKSLKYVYERLNQMDAAGAAAASPADGVGVGNSSSSSSSMEPFEAISDCFGQRVKLEEIVSILSSTYTSYFYIYYNLVRDASPQQQQQQPSPSRSWCGLSKGRLDSASIVQKKYPVVWSFSVA